MNTHIQPGTLLLSVPELQDPNFMHSIVLIGEHSDKGAYGLVLNQTTGLTSGQIFADREGLSDTSFPVHTGGPVGRDTLQFLHNAPDVVTGGRELADGVYIGGEFDGLARLLEDEERARERLRLYLGYSGWGAGQLDGEFAIGSWMPATLEADIVFSSESTEDAWRRVMRSLGKTGRDLAQMPPDVTWN
ncbi:MAG: YqgE/AlgH family protein [Candidatus Poribacteria bacterium]|jgi:putative transcriptional regulator